MVDNDGTCFYQRTKGDGVAAQEGKKKDQVPGA